MAVTETVDTQQGATIVIGSGGSFNIVKISGVKKKGGSIDVTHLGTVDQRPHIPHDLYSIDVLEVEVQNGPGLAEPTLHASNTVTITGPIPPSGASGEIWAGTGFVVAIDGPSFEAGSEAYQKKIFRIQYQGVINGGTKVVRTAAA